MGMYTGVRCKAIIKEEYRSEIDKLINGNGYWEDTNVDFMKKYSKYSRANFIPFGCLSYMPDEWEGENETATDGFDRQFNIKSGYLSFQCSLKNYEDTIKVFFDSVLNKIVESIIHLEVYYEEWEYSESFRLENGEIVLDNDKFIKYIDDYDPYDYL